MKRMILVLLAIFLVVPLVSCEAGTNNQRGTTQTTQTTEPKTPIDELTDDEKTVFEALKIMSKDFFDPAGFRLLEISYSSERNGNSSFGNKTTGVYGFPVLISGELKNGTFHSVDVRIQGENRVGGTLNHYYAVRLDTLPEYIAADPEQAAKDKAKDTAKERWDSSSEDSFPKSSFETFEDYMQFLCEYYAECFCTEAEAKQYFGKYCELGYDQPTIYSAEYKYNISKINKALKYYWDQKLGND